MPNPEVTIVESDNAADLLRQCREAAGATTYDLMKRGVSTGTVTRIESGESDPSVGTLAATIAPLGFRLRLVAERKESIEG